MAAIWLVVLGAILGGGIALIIIETYYQKASKTQRELFEKLSEDLRNEIIALPEAFVGREQLSRMLEK